MLKMKYILKYFCLFKLNWSILSTCFLHFLSIVIYWIHQSVNSTTSVQHWSDKFFSAVAYLMWLRTMRERDLSQIEALARLYDFKSSMIHDKLYQNVCRFHPSSLFYNAIPMEQQKKMRSRTIAPPATVYLGNRKNC